MAEVSRGALEDAMHKGLWQHLNGMAVDRGLPPLRWMVRAVERGELRVIAGQAGVADHADPVRVVDVWADAFGAFTSVRQHERFPTLETRFVLDGVQVTVWCPISAEVDSDG